MTISCRGIYAFLDFGFLLRMFVVHKLLGRQRAAKQTVFSAFSSVHFSSQLARAARLGSYIPALAHRLGTICTWARSKLRSFKRQTKKDDLVVWASGEAVGWSFGGLSQAR
jgi:hypothetical protein